MVMGTLPASAERLDVSVLSTRVLVRTGESDVIRILSDQPDSFAFDPERGTIREVSLLATIFGSGVNSSISGDRSGGRITINYVAFQRPPIDEMAQVIIELPKDWQGRLDVEARLFALVDVDAIGQSGCVLSSSLNYTDGERAQIIVGKLRARKCVEVTASLSGEIAGESVVVGKGALDLSASLSGRIGLQSMSAKTLTVTGSQGGSVIARQQSFARRLAVRASQSGAVTFHNIDTGTIEANGSMSGSVSIAGSAGSGSASASMSATVKLRGVFYSISRSESMSGRVSVVQEPGTPGERFTRAIMRNLPVELEDDRIALGLLASFGQMLAIGLAQSCGPEAPENAEMQRVVDLSIPAALADATVIAALSAASQAITANGGTFESLADSERSAAIMALPAVRDAYGQAFTTFATTTFSAAERLA